MHTKIVAILTARGKPTSFGFRLQDDGSGPYIAHWDEAKLGPRPTQEELDSVDVAKIEHNAGIDRQIAAVEAANLAPRFSREAILIGILKDHMRDFSVDAATALAQLTTVGGARYNAGFVRLKGLDDQIKALRAQRLP